MVEISQETSEQTENRLLNVIAQSEFKIFSFHFKDCADNSGFVGWLASHLKTELGTGVFVTCGQNIKRGGIYDYWGCPIEISEDVVSEIKKLISQGKKRLSD